MPIPILPIAIPVAAAVGAGTLGFFVGRAASYEDYEDEDEDGREEREEEESPGGVSGIDSKTREEAGSRWSDMSRAEALEILELELDANPAAILEAHERLVQRIKIPGPGRGGRPRERRAARLAARARSAARPRYAAHPDPMRPRWGAGATVPSFHC